jgi:hypothetical protein
MSAETRDCQCCWRKPTHWPLTDDLATCLPWCKYLQVKIKELTTTEEVWNGDPIRIRPTSSKQQESDKHACLRASAHKHISGYDCSHPASIILAKHHWQRELLLKNKTRNCKTVTVFLNLADAAAIQQQYTGFSNLTDNCNQVENIISSLKRAPGKPKDAAKFVQAPISTKEDVESFVRDLISKKSLLIQKRKDKAAEVAQKVATAAEQKQAQKQVKATEAIRKSAEVEAYEEAIAAEGVRFSRVLQGYFRGFVVSGETPCVILDEELAAEMQSGQLQTRECSRTIICIPKIKFQLRRTMLNARSFFWVGT